MYVNDDHPALFVIEKNKYFNLLRDLKIDPNDCATILDSVDCPNKNSAKIHELKTSTPSLEHHPFHRKDFARDPKLRYVHRHYVAGAARVYEV